MQARELENHVNPAFLPDNNYENHAFYPCFSGGVLVYSGVNNAVFRNPGPRQAAGEWGLGLRSRIGVSEWSLGVGSRRA